MLKRVKRIKAVKPPKDFNEFGRYLVDLTTASDPPKVTEDEVSRVMANLGARGGKIGGKRRLETMTPEQRSAVALKAARARWSKERKKKR
ncbi:MAG TPA: hypothetical protein VEP46_07600 [Vicinamibacterales bacterium]|nr:hypothetical protein [Vicinamibacterales bacterium]